MKINEIEEIKAKTAEKLIIEGDVPEMRIYDLFTFTKLILIFYALLKV